MNTKSLTRFCGRVVGKNVGKWSMVYLQMEKLLQSFC